MISFFLYNILQSLNGLNLLPPYRIKHLVSSKKFTSLNQFVWQSYQMKMEGLTFRIFGSIYNEPCPTISRISQREGSSVIMSTVLLPFGQIPNLYCPGTRRGKDFKIYSLMSSVALKKTLLRRLPGSRGRSSGDMPISIKCMIL